MKEQGVADMTLLSKISEGELKENLKKRYDKDIIYVSNYLGNIGINNHTIYCVSLCYCCHHVV